MKPSKPNRASRQSIEVAESTEDSVIEERVMELAIRRIVRQPPPAHGPKWERRGVAVSAEEFELPGD